MRYRCMVWYRNGQEDATPSLAYGDFPERGSIDEAYNDLVSVKVGSMKNNSPYGNFYATVVEYPDGHPPTKVRRTVYFEIAP